VHFPKRQEQQILLLDRLRRREAALISTSDGKRSGRLTMAKAAPRAIEGEINRLRSLALEELRGEWRRLYVSEPPQISRDLLVLGLGYRLKDRQKDHRSALVRSAFLRTAFARSPKAEDRDDRIG
jgi:Protein of unknown function (DUF2924)